jgi:hypothetical protein
MMKLEKLWLVMLFAENAVKTWVLLVIGENQGVSMNRILLTNNNDDRIYVDMDKVAVIKAEQRMAKRGSRLFQTLGSDSGSMYVQESPIEIIKEEMKGNKKAN